MIKQAQRTAIMRDPTMAAATLVGAQADAMKAAASNEAGAMNGFVGMGMAMNAGGGMNAQNLFAMGQNQPQPTAPAANTWTCPSVANSAQNAVPKNRKAHSNISVTNAVGLPKIPSILPNSVPSAVICLMSATKSKGAR